MKLTRLLATLGLVSAALVVAACGSNGSSGDPAQVGVTVDGLSVVEMDEGAGKLVVQYKRDGRTLTYDLRLGPKMENPPSPQALEQNPEQPTYQVDAQVVDERGLPIHLQMGGDSFIDSSWRMPNVEGFDEALRVKDIALMSTAIDAFRKLKVPAGLEQLRLAGIDIGRSVDTVYEKPGVTKPVTTPGAGEGTLTPKGALASGGSTVVKWDYRIRNQSIFGGLGQHTAVHLRGWTSGGSVAFNAYSCNHGACAGSTSMTTHCTMTGFRTDDGTHTRYFYSEPSSSTGTVSGGCATHYDWDSTSVNGGAHNCNDDSELQRNAIWSDSSQNTSAGSCNSLGFNNYSPGCN